ncbi:PREDICTED: transcriptional repressor ILP1-like [Lupinus angustifolius]|uniref:transcriptional repressor ILP1-like n=1 Tax=Lupinus angustifolius TaxID=3871 RepID=UPI00092F3575|nr:PREDICTED: transcriptional repressor ILP1-like [Lupinus angustifolius]
MSTAKSRNFRRRGGNTDSTDNDTNDTTSTTLPSKPPSSSSSKPKKPQAPKLLSFADETETPPLRTSSSAKHHHHRSSATTSSKPSSSHKITTHRDRISHSSSPSVPSNVQPQAGFYTKEALLELQKNTRTLVTSSTTSRISSDSKPNSEPVVVLKGLVKPSPSEPEARDSDSEEDEAKLGFSNGKGLSGGSGSFYPDEETIKAIRAKRERLRQARPVAPDFISLDGGSNHGAAEGLSDEEPEFRGRIAMFGDKIEGVKKGVFEDVDERRFKGNVARDDDRVDDDGGFNDEDEEKLWEEEQFRKGLGKRMDEGSAARADVVPVMQSAQQHSFVVPTAYSAVQSASVSLGVGGVMGAVPQSSFDVMHMSQQAEVAKKAMKQNMSRLKESHGRTMQLLNQTDQNLSTSLLNITDLESSLVLADEKYRFMQKLQNYVTNICDFLQHKASYIEELEEQMKKLHEDRASAISGRRETNNEDEMMEVEAAVNAAAAVFSRKGNNNLEAAKSAAEDAFTAVKKQRDLPVKLDEFGRDLNLEERMKMKVRAKSRQSKRSKSFDYSKLASMELGDHKVEGESSTDESDSETQAYQSQHDLLLQAADEIFSDACEDYGQLSLVKKRFEEWKKEYFTSYNDAYISLSLPLIFSPYARLELLRWDPLHKGLDFQEMKWYKLLFTYGLPEDGKDFVNDDGDVDLVPNLVEKVALPILHYEISHCWDMLSQQETSNAINATKLIVQHLSHESEALADLLVSIRTRLADAVAKLTVPTWSPPILAAVPDAARVAAYRFGVSVRLLRNICLWKDIFAMPVLEKLALDELLCGKVLPHFRSISENVHDAITRTERIIASLSGVWAGPNVTGERSQKLQPLVTYVLSLGRILERRNVPESETSNLARRLKKMLVDLNDYDHARNMARTFRLKEAL